MKNAVIMIPFAHLEGENSGVNLSKSNDRVSVYLRNCCVAAISAKHFNPEVTVRLVTNYAVPKVYGELLTRSGVEIFHQEFTEYTFPNYVWALAFYKLCALKAVVRENKFDYFCYMDSDVYIQGNFEDIWKECDSHILLYDICHGLQVPHYRHFLNEIYDFLGSEKLVTHYGGEFFAADRMNARLFIERCDGIYQQMREREFVTTHGDEFILSLSADSLCDKVKNAGAYIFRFWTGSFRLVSTCYRSNAVLILHVPAEKENGMLKLYKHYFSQGKVPSLKRMHSILHLTHPSILTKLKVCIAKLLRKK